MSCRETELTEKQKLFLAEETVRCTTVVGSWEPATCLDYVCKAFLVPKPGVSDKWRVVVDLRPLNKFCKKNAMRSETLGLLATLAKKGDWMVTFDLKDGYNAVGVHPDDRKFMTFNMNGTFYQCAAVPFGWNQSAFVFCETVRVWVQWMRAPVLVETVDGAEAAAAAEQRSSETAAQQRRPLRTGRVVRGADRAARLSGKTATQRAKLRMAETATGAPRLRSKVLRPGAKRGRGVRLLWYVDDLLLLSESKEEALAQRAFVEAALAVLGLQRNEKKGMWEPAQVATHLGMSINMLDGTFELTPERQAKLRRLSAAIGAKAAREKRWVPVKDLAALAGLAQSAYLAIPPARFYLRELHDVVASRTSWVGRVRLTKQALRDLKWWRDVPQRWAARPIWRSADTAFLHCDASGEIGWGGVLNGLRPTRGFWREHQKPLHITLKELKEVRFTVESFVRDLTGKRVLL